MFFQAGVIINQAQLAVSADPKHKDEGDPDPALTYTYGTLYNGDTAAGVFAGALTRQAGETTGGYRTGGDVLVTKVAGPALSHILSQVSGVVAELGGSTSHMASLARERGIPMVLGVLDATRKIPDGVMCAVDGVSGVVRWQR